MRALGEVLLPAGLEVVEEGWFALSDVQKVTVPASVREIGKGAFACCKKLSEVCFGENSALEKLGAVAFAWSGLYSFTAPTCLRAVGQGSFYGCKQLACVTLNEGLEILGEEQCADDCDYGVFEDSALASVTLPSTLKRIEHRTFRHCESLTTVQLSTVLEKLGKECFAESGLGRVEVPSSVGTIEEGSFKSCAALKNVCF